jgi:catechol 2,3-dioxygenase
MTMGTVTLSVTDLDRSLDYYTQHIGLKLLSRDATSARLGGDDDALLDLRAGATRPADPRASGLYHFALLVPSRTELGRTLHHLIENRTPIGGASDHAVSEALYLSDPDGHGIEIYRDRPRTDWYDSRGSFYMTTQRMDVEGVLGAADADDRPWTGIAPGTIMGHVHLQVGDVDAARDFYVHVIGLDHMIDYPSARFLSAGGYHHHLGANMWQSEGRGQAAGGTAQLLSYTIRLPDQAAHDEVWARVVASGAPTETWDGAPAVLDPAGNRLRFEVG